VLRKVTVTKTRLPPHYKRSAIPQIRNPRFEICNKTAQSKAVSRSVLGKVRVTNTRLPPHSKEIRNYLLVWHAMR
jgi:hypothetical protein